MNLFTYASPPKFYQLAGRLWPIFALVSAVLLVVGLWISFFVAPTDAQQGKATASSLFMCRPHGCRW